MEPQPESLFGIPKEYKGSAMPIGGILEMFTGQSKEQSQQKMDETGDKLQEVGKMLENANDPNKIQEQKLQEAMKLLEQSMKKK